MIIYKVTNRVNGKIYIGQTTITLQKRKNQHERAYRYKNSKNNIFSRAIKKYGKQNFIWEIIDSAKTLEELNKKEEMWIKHFNSLKEGGWGYNIKMGGNNHKHADITKRLIGLSQKGEKNHMYGKTGELNKTSKKVIEKHTGIVYASASECAKELGLQFSKVCAVCRGDRGSTGGRVFRYLDEKGEIIEPENSKTQHRKRIINLNTKQIFSTLDEATNSVNIKDGSNLHKALKSGEGVCYLYDTFWCYEGVDKSKIQNLTKPPIKKKGYETLSKKIINTTTNVVFNSIAEGARSIGVSKSTLSNKLKNNNGVCILKGQEWKLI